MIRMRVIIGGMRLSVSGSNNNEISMDINKIAKKEKPNLAALRNSITGNSNATTSHTITESQRRRGEQQIKLNINREKRLRLLEQNERLQNIKKNVSMELDLQHQLTLEQLESEWRREMESDLTRLQQETMKNNELILRDEFEQRLVREQGQLFDQIRTEKERKLEDFRNHTTNRLEKELENEYQKRLDFHRERLEIEFNQAFFEQSNAINDQIRTDLEKQFNIEIESEEIRLEGLHQDRLLEREAQLKASIRIRLEQQAKQHMEEREAQLRAEYARRGRQLEEEIAMQIQSEIERDMREQTSLLEQEMREDVEMALARRKEEIRTLIERELSESYSEKLAERKSRLQERYDLLFQQNVDEIDSKLRSNIKSEMDRKIDDEFNSYKLSKEAEMQNELSKFRYEQESFLRETLSENYESKRKDWVKKLELEFDAREDASKKSILSEIDAQMRNERITRETDLDLLREETGLELEVEMEARLEEFRGRKMEEVATHLEKQLLKLEEIMRNKALIEVRRREGEIRKEIESQLGIKREEIRDRLKMLNEQMDKFREMAEEKMRDQIRTDFEAEISVEEEKLEEAQDVMDQLKSDDALLSKRQAWLGAIAGDKVDPLQQQGGLLGGKLGQGLGGSTLAGSIPKSTPILGGAPIGTQRPTLKPIRSPIAEEKSPTAAVLPKPVHTSIKPKLEPIIEVSEDGEETEFKIPKLITEELEEISTEESMITEEDESEISKVLEETLDDADQIIEMLSSEIEEREQVIENVIKKANVASLKKLDTPTLKPSSTTLKPVETSVLKPKTTTLMPSKAAVLKPSGTTLVSANNVLIPQENNESEKVSLISIADIAKEEIAQQKLEEE